MSKLFGGGKKSVPGMLTPVADKSPAEGHVALFSDAAASASTSSPLFAGSPPQAAQVAEGAAEAGPPVASCSTDVTASVQPPTAALGIFLNVRR